MADSVRFDDSKPYAEGRFRSAYLGQWIAPESKAGQKCVVKKFTNSYTWEPTGWDTTIKMYDKCREYASAFGRNIEFVDCSCGKMQESSNAPRGPHLNEYVTHETYLEGDFKKWCNNYGSVSPEARGVDGILTAFMHWTWCMSKGQEMVADIQGVKQGSRYILTDPAMISVNEEYGATDTGVEGMAMFFLIHGCTSACSHLPKLTLAQFVGKIPDAMLQQALALQQLSKCGTTYTRETKFSPEIREGLKTAFVNIAEGRSH